MNKGSSSESPLHKAAPHEAGLRHTSGEARYVDDIDAPRGCLVAWILTSPHAHAKVIRRDASAARETPGVRAVLFAADIPGHNLIGPIVHDEEVLADAEVHYVGQPVALVVGETYEAVRDAAERVEVEYEALPTIDSIQAAIAADAYVGVRHVIQRGDVAQALADSEVVVRGEVATGGQDHFYLETHAALAVPLEDGNWHVHSSTQHPTEIQRMVAEVLGISANKVVCEAVRMGGGFGGKESQASTFAALAAIGAQATGRPVKVWLNRDQDMTITGNRHPFWSRYAAGFDAEGRLQALEVDIYSDAGFTEDLSMPVLDRALFHLDNAYYVPTLRFAGRACRTNRPSNTAFRGFGGPQGVFVVEEALNRVSEQLGLDPARVRERNFYGVGERDVTPYGQTVEGNRMPRLFSELMASSEYARRRAEIDAFNARSPNLKRGIGFQPVKFGISFTKSLLNQAGAFVLVYTDGTVQLNHGGTEMGQGLHTKMIAVCAHELGVPASAVRIMNTATDKVPNTSATAASSGSDLNGAAIQDACRKLRERMLPVAAKRLGADVGDLVFEGGEVRSGQAAVSFAELANQCWVEQVSLAATGYYATPGIAYDAEAGQGTPFFYFAFGGAVTEVEVSPLTGEYRVVRADILHDVGSSLVPSIDRGQIEGAFVQGVGWLTCEEVLFRDDGSPVTTGPSTYKIPAIGDVPDDLRVALLDRAANDKVVGGSKAVGEPPFVLGISAITALRHAISACGAGPVDLKVPATPEAVLRAIVDRA